MGDALSADERLPWLDAPRPARPIPVARRARTPLLVLLGLFLISGIAVIAYLTGRSTAPVPARSSTEWSPAPTVLPPAPTPAPGPAPAPAPIPAAPILPPAPVVTTPPPPTVDTVRAAPAEPRATRFKANRDASVRRSSPRRPALAVVAQQNTQPAPTAPTVYAVPQVRTVWRAQPFGGPRGRVIQLGAHLTQPKADAALWRLARIYPYVATLPRMVTWYGPSPGRPRYYRIRLATGSSREARALCRNLHRLNRACAVV